MVLGVIVESLGLYFKKVLILLENIKYNPLDALLMPYLLIACCMQHEIYYLIACCVQTWDKHSTPQQK